MEGNACISSVTGQPEGRGVPLPGRSPRDSARRGAGGTRGQEGCGRPGSAASSGPAPLTSSRGSMLNGFLSPSTLAPIESGNLASSPSSVMLHD